MTSDDRIRRIQRWIGAPETGDLNDPGTIDELENDVVGLRSYLDANYPTPITPITPITPAPSYTAHHHHTPNRGGSLDAEGIVWHHSNGSLSSNIGWITRDSQAAGRPCSYHIIIDTNGDRHHFVPLNRQAWHAGKSSHRGRYGCNRFMLGIAFTGDTNTRDLTAAELSSAVDLVRSISQGRRWTIDDMTDHRTVSPGRRDDLHPAQWQRLKWALKSAF